MAELDNPLMNSMNETQHYESHVEGNEGRVHFMKGGEEEQKGSGKRYEENGESETNTMDATEPMSKGGSTSSNTTDVLGSTSSTNATSTTTNSTSTTSSTSTTNVVSNPTITNNTNHTNNTNNITNTRSRINNSGERYMDYHHPSGEADPYLYSLYYQMDFIEDDKGEKTYV